MTHAIPINWDDKKIVRLVFLFGAAYFMLTTGYSLVHYSEKFLLDGYSLIFNILNDKWFPPAVQREVMYLQQVVPVVLAMAGFKAKWVMIGYILNAYLLYFLFFAVTLLLFKDPFSALLVVLVHYKGDPYNYFFFVEELLPGACLVIVFLSLFRALPSLRYRKAAYAGGLFLLFFIVRSHPLALVCLMLGMALLFFIDRQLFVQQKKLVMVMGVGVVLLIGTKWFFLNHYDTGVISHTKGFRTSLVQLLSPAYLSEIIYYLFFLRKIFTTVFMVTLGYLLFKEKYRTIVAVTVLTIAAIVLFNLVVTDSDFKAWELEHTSLDRWSLPVRFVIFAAFCYVIIPEIKTMQYFRAAGIFATLYFAMGAIQVMEGEELSCAYLRQANHIILKCRQEGVAKAVIDRRQLKESLPVMTNCYQDIMILSSLHGPDSTVQVVYVNHIDSFPFETTGKDIVFLDEGDGGLPQDMIDTNYFRLREEPYVYVDLEDDAVAD